MRLRKAPHHPIRPTREHAVVDLHPEQQSAQYGGPKLVKFVAHFCTVAFLRYVSEPNVPQCTSNRARLACTMCTSKFVLCKVVAQAPTAQQRSIGMSHLPSWP